MKTLPLILPPKRREWILAWVVIIICLLQSLTLGEDEQKGETILVVSTFPFRRTLEREIQIQAKGLPALSRVTVQTLHTFGEAKTLDDTLKEVGPDRIRAAICLDVAAARMFVSRTSTTCIVLGRSAESVVALYGKSEAPPSREEVVETLPPAESVVNALLGLRPRPDMAGLIFTEGSPDSEQFAVDFDSLWREGAGRDNGLTTCSVSAAGCRNAHAMAETLRSAFAGLPTGTALVVLPGANTLKFAYVIRQCVDGQGLALVTVGDMPATAAACHVAYGTRDLARHCLERALFLSQSDDAPKPLPQLRDPQGVFDAEALSRLGLSVPETAVSP